MTWGLALRAARGVRGLGQSELAEAAGLTENYISLLERDRRRPSDEAVERIADALGVAPSTLRAMSAPAALAIAPEAERSRVATDLLGAYLAAAGV